MEAIARATVGELQALAGRTVDAVFQDEGYWHLFVALRCTDGQTLVFTSEDVGVAKYFEVFPLKVKVEPTSQRNWRLLPEAKTIQRVTALLREEWLEPSAGHPGLGGSAPHHVHRAGRGPASAEAVERTVVQAGVHLHFGHTASMVVYASNSAPFNVEVAFSQVEVERALAAFNAMRPNPAFEPTCLRQAAQRER